MWDSIKTAVRNATSIFGKPGGSHKECPRCRGSGLLHSSGRLHLAPSNEPCWFCEGVGALPIIGLKGFVFARAISSLQNCKQSQCLPPPLMLGLHNGKYPETRCNLKAFKTHEEVANLVHDFSNAPSWLGPSVQRAATKDETNEFQRIHHETTEAMKTTVKCSKSSSSNQTLKSRLKGFRLFQVSNRRNVQVLPTTPSVSSNAHLQTTSLCSMATTEHRSVKASQRRSARFETGLSGNTSYHGLPSQSLVNDDNGQTNTSQPSISKMQADVLNSSRFSFPFVLGLQSEPSTAVHRGHRRPRKKRNRIREKAQKEALERARKIIGTLKFQKDESSVAEQIELPDVNSFIRRCPSDVRSFLLKPSTAGGQSLSFAATEKDGLGGNFSSSAHSWLDVLISSKTQNLLRLPSSRQRPSKSQLER